MSTKLPSRGYELVAGQFTCVETGELFCQCWRQDVNAGEDAALLHPGIIFSFPLFFSKPDGVMVTIEIDSQVISGRSAMMHLRYVPDLGTEKDVLLGVWNPGEGCLSIRDVVLDWLKSQIHPDEASRGFFKTKCPNGAHSLKSSKIMNLKCTDAPWKVQCLWNIVLEGACTPCIEETKADFGSNFGVDPSLLTSTTPWR